MDLWEEFSLARADCECREPLAPRLARPGARDCSLRAVRRLREAIALHVRGELDLAFYQPSELLLSCVLPDGRLAVGQRDERYFRAVREVLDVLSALGTRVSEAAERIGVSTAHLVKFIQTDAKVWERVNQMRAEAGVKPLR